MQELTIRPIREGDIEGVIAVDRKVGGERRAGWWRGLLGLYLGDGGSPADNLAPIFCQVAEADGRVVGFILGDVQSWQFGIPRCGRIVAIGVDPEHGRQGIATRLAKGLIEVFRERNLPHVQCLAREDDPLFAFFGSLGFAAGAMQVLEKKLQD